MAANVTSKMRPIVDREFECTDAIAALRHLHSDDHFGMVALRV